MPSLPVRSRRRPPHVSLAVLSLFAVLLMVSPPLAVAQRTSIRYVPPYAGLTSYLTSYSYAYGCGNSSSTPTPPSFNNSSGHLAGRLDTSVVPGKACVVRSYALAYEYLFLEGISPTFSVSTGGLYVLRTNWWFEWRLNYSTQVAASPANQTSQANAQFAAYMYVADLTTNTTTPSTVVYYSAPGVFDVNASGQIKENSWISLPIVAALTHRQVYQLVFFYDIYVVSAAGAYPNSARASLDLGTTGKGMVLQAITIK